MGSIRLCRDDERPAILEIVNVAAAAAYHETPVVLADPPFGS